MRARIEARGKRSRFIDGFKPSPLLQALCPVETAERVGNDRYVKFKEQFLLEKFKMTMQIREDNERQRKLQPILDLVQPGM